MTLDYKSYFEDVQPAPKYWGKEGAGVIFISKDTGRILLAHRSNKVQFEPETWGTWGGKLDNDETPKQAAEREVQEETGFGGKYTLHHLWDFRDPGPDNLFVYHDYMVLVDFEFTPELNWENDNSKWVEYGEWPTPLHWGFELLIQNAGGKIQKVLGLINKKKEKLNEMDSPPAIIQPAVPKPANTISLTNSAIVAATLWGEARGEGEKGMQAVMNVIMNRAKGDFSKTSKVVLKPSQFSMWNKIEDPEQSALNLSRAIRKKAPQDADSYMKAVEIVDKAAMGNLPDITGGATSYFNPKKVNPLWAKKMIKTKTIGNHDFYKPQSKISEAISSKSLGLEDVDTYAYEIRSQYSYLRYSHNRNTNIFYLRNIGTEVDQRHKGYATELLDIFFRLIKAKNGTLDPETYTTLGAAYIKHVVERLARQYGVRMI